MSVFEWVAAQQTYFAHVHRRQVLTDRNVKEVFGKDYDVKKGKDFYISRIVKGRQVQKAQFCFCSINQIALYKLEFDLSTQAQLSNPLRKSI